MKNLTSSKILLAAVSLAIAIPLTSYAEPSEKKDCQHRQSMKMGEKSGGYRFGPHAGIPRSLAGLHLSDAQQDQIFALTYPQIPLMRQHAKARHQVMGDLQKLSHNEQFDEAKAKSLSEQLATLEKEAAFNRARVDSQIFALLTPEQRKQLIERKSHRAYKSDVGHLQNSGFRHQFHHRRDSDEKSKS